MDIYDILERKISFVVANEIIFLKLGLKTDFRFI